MASPEHLAYYEPTLPVSRALQFTMNTDKPAENLNLPFIKRKYSQDFTPEELHRQRRLPILSRVPTRTKNHIIAFAGEFIGTFMFLFLALSGTQVANNSVYAGSPVGILYIALAFGFSLAVNAWVFFRITVRQSI